MNERSGEKTRSVLEVEEEICKEMLKIEINSSERLKFSRKAMTEVEDEKQNTDDYLIVFS
mgnify:CR=1 FL=1